MKSLKIYFREERYIAMKIGISIDIRELEQALPIIFRWNHLIEHIQIYLDARASQGDSLTLLNFIGKIPSGISTSFHSYGYLNLSEPNETIRSSMLKVGYETIGLLHYINGEFVNFHLGYSLSSGVSKEDLLQVARESVFKLAYFAQQYQVEVHIENDIFLKGGISLGTSLFDLLSVINKGPRNLFICYDIGHANLTMNIPYTYHEILNHIKSMHVHNNDALEDQHKAFGDEGSIDLYSIALDNCLQGRDICFIFENDLEGCNRALANYERLIREPR